MTRTEFLELPEWHALVRSMSKMADKCVEAALEANNIAEVRYNAGFRDALHSVIKLPNSILNDGEPKRNPPPEGVVELPNHPKAVMRAY